MQPAPALALALVALGAAAAAASDPDVGRSGPELIAARGYPVERHWVETDDHYVLGMIRIPRPGAPPVLLQHGLLDSADTWLMGRAVSDSPLTNYSSLAYAFYDQGFDVWLGNSRGNKYSRNNTRLDPSGWPFNGPFWDFDWESMARYDMPAQVAHALKVNGAARLVYVGHSQGTTQAFANFATPEWSVASRVSLFVALAPVAHVSHTTSLLMRALIDFDVPELVQLLGVHEFLPTSELLRLLLPDVCKATPWICDDVAYAVTGAFHVDKARLPVFVAHFPSGTSVTDMCKWAQGVRRGAFARWDYGLLGNPLHYHGALEPPSYNLTASRPPPTALYYGGQDDLADPTDVGLLLAEYPPGALVDHTFTPAYGHMDYTWGDSAYLDLFPGIFRLAHNASAPEREAAAARGRGRH